MAAEEEKRKERACCPYCDAEILGSKLPFCQPCGVREFHCPKCHKAFSSKERVCPHCGAEVRG